MIPVLFAAALAEPPERVAPVTPHPVEALEKTDSGLQYADLVVGDGPAPYSGKKATVEYTLWLADGTRLDSSYLRDGPFTYTVGRNQVIPGWEEAVRGMHVGGTRHFRVPWKLGYGRRGNPPRIPRKAELVFEVELVDVK